MSDPLTLDEIDDKVTTLYYMQRVNFEAADEIGAKTFPIWKRLPKATRLRDFVTETPSRTNPYHHVYNRLFEVKDEVAAFDRTVSLAGLLSEGNWPAFDLDDENDKVKHVNAWIELIGHSEEAKDIRDQISSIGTQITLLLHGVTNQAAQDLRGWYVRVDTGRRNAVGWVVGGRGNVLHVQPDRLANVHRMLRNPGGHTQKTTGMTALAAVAPWVFHTDGTDPEVMKFSMKHAVVKLLLPPDMAKDRKVWGEQVLSTAVAHRDAAQALHTDYLKWQAEAEPIQKRIKTGNDWHKALPTDFRKKWVEDGSMRWIVGGAEALDILLSLISEDELRDAVVAKHRAANPELTITEAEFDFINSPPANGHEDIGVCLSRVVRAACGGRASQFAPMF